MAIKKVTKKKDKKVTDRQAAYDAIDLNSDLGVDIRARLALLEEILGLKQQYTNWRDKKWHKDSQDHKLA